MSKLIVVVGATGGQGGSVAKYFLSDPEYRVRGVTRNPEGQKAHDLKALGVEIVKADVGDVESLEKAFEGAYAIFAVTDYYETFFAKGKTVAIETEFRNGCNLAKAASKIPTLRRYLWSTLPLTSKLSQGEAIVPHFEGKGRVDQYIRENHPDLLDKSTFLIFGIFSDNIVNYPIFKPIWLDAAKKWIQIWPTSADAPFHSLADHKVNTGIFVHAVVTANSSVGGGTYVTCFVESLTVGSALEVWGKATGRATEPGSTAIVSVTPENLVGLCGQMGEEQASQWIFFKYMSEKGIVSLPGSVDGLTLLTEKHKQSLETTEQSWAKLAADV